ncbi:MAG: AIR synthase-related protein [Phycisphaerae bacterium]
MADYKVIPSGRWYVCVRPRTPRLDVHGRDVLTDIHHMGLGHIEAVASSRIYLLMGKLPESAVRMVAKKLLTDPVAEDVEFGLGFSLPDGPTPAVEVHLLPGVMDPVALSALAAISRLLASEGPLGCTITAVRTVRRYEIAGVADACEVERIAARVLANSCIERWYIRAFDRRDETPDDFPTAPETPFVVRRVPIRQLDDDGLIALSHDAHLFLSLEEMQVIRARFDDQDRDPTDLELETLAQTWSEHCVHKTLKSEIVYRGDDFGRPGEVKVHFGNLLRDTIAAATATLNRPWCLSVFVDNAGVIAFDDEYGIAFKVETHNHPSAIEPYGGAATGIGGCIRDIMGCGLGAKPIASTDVFCLARPDYDAARLPKDVLHPRRTLKGVVAGVRDYGNRMGIPTVNGAVLFDDRYLANPLVFCGCVGMIPRNRIAKEPSAGDHIVLAGGRTGRDGIHGATFSSAELTDSHAQEFSNAVQIGNAIEEKKLLDALLIARDHPEGCLFTAVTDCGAGGLSSAVGEMGRHLGALVDLDRVPLKYSGLRYDEIWISEAQERMVFAVAPGKLDLFLSVFADEEVEATVIGTFTDDQMLRVRYTGITVGELEMSFLHEGLPKSARTATWRARASKSASGAHAKRYEVDAGLDNNRLLEALGKPNIASKEWIIRQYDHEVQGRSVIKPLCGPEAGPADAAVLRPRHDCHRGIAVGCGICPELGDVDPYEMAVAAVDEALRNVICVGANPSLTAILDNFCWPKVDAEEALGALVRACKGAMDAAVAYGLPFISGKDSLNNEFSMGQEEAARVGLPTRVAIPYTLLISALGIVDDVGRSVTADLKQPGHCLVLASAPVARVGLSSAMDMHRQVAHLIADCKVRAAHDISDGGLAVAVAEMCIAAGLGATVDIDNALDEISILAPMTASYILEMSEADAGESGLPTVGRIESDSGQAVRLRICLQGTPLVDLPITALEEAWKRPLAHGGGT